MFEFWCRKDGIKKENFLETNSSACSISKSKMQGIFQPDFASHRIKLQNKTQNQLNNLSINKIGGYIVYLVTVSEGRVG